jgi:hypothetical protein
MTRGELSPHGRLEIGIMAGFRSVQMAGFILECLAGFVGIRTVGRFGKQDFAYLPEDDVYRCPAGERLRYYHTNEEDGQMLRRYWTNACRN